MLKEIVDFSFVDIRYHDSEIGDFFFYLGKLRSFVQQPLLYFLAALLFGFQECLVVGYAHIVLVLAEL